MAVEEKSMCLYRTISVAESDRAGSVVREAMRKHGIEGDPSNYHLHIVNHHLDQRKQQLQHLKSEIINYLFLCRQQIST